MAMARVVSSLLNNNTVAAVVMAMDEKSEEEGYEEHDAVPGCNVSDVPMQLLHVNLHDTKSKGGLLHGAILVGVDLETGSRR